MEDCNICYQSKETFLTASVCGHSLCVDCFKLLQKNECPFCRQSYTQEELQIKGTNNNNSNQYINIPPSYQAQNINLRLDLYEDENYIIEIPFSRVRRNMIRKRRRNLTFEEVKLRRQRIRKQMKLKWRRKNGRLRKHNLVY